MEYALLFSVMGTVIVFQQYRVYKLNKGIRIMAMMMDKVINKEVEVIRTDNGFEVKVMRKT
jgi:hypothetical protein